ncbi:hypothetical protein BVU76_03800 [Mycolicibacterium porcinum]|nr:hypothetical protein BVU76_03800 [Mycolicibacterium porcinum]
MTGSRGVSSSVSRSGLGGIAGVQEAGASASGRDEQLTALDDVGAMGGNSPVLVLHEKAAPQQGPTHGGCL